MTATTSAGGSLWIDTASAPPRPPLRGQIDADVCVIGAGIAGLSSAVLLQAAGRRVVVLEADRVGHGVSGCTTGKVSALQASMLQIVHDHHGDAGVRAYARASERGVDFVSRMVDEHDIDCDLRRADAVSFALAPGEAETVAREQELAEGAGLAVLGADPGLPLDTHGAVVLPDQLALHPLRYVQGLAAALERDGGTVCEESRVLSVQDGEPCLVRTAGGSVRASDVVVATHFPILDRGLYFTRLDAMRSYCIAATLRSGDPPQSMAISVGENSRSIRGFGEWLIVGGEGHPAGARQAVGERYAALERFARAHWDVAELTHRWSAQDPVAYDHLPMVGAYEPRTAHLHVMTGWMKWGLSTAGCAAEIVAARIQGRADPLADAFDPARVTTRGLPALARAGARFGGDLVLDRLRRPQARRSAQIPRGEARVLPDGPGGAGRKGVYRDGDGALHAVSLRCTHLGCLLRFNAAEVSWDCPCHGSRFDVDGEVLEGPAVESLAPRRP